MTLYPVWTDWTHSEYHIISEYEANIDTKKQNTFANRFLKWLYTNQANENLVKTVKIDMVSEFDFEQLTDEIRAIGIDKSDLKFVAVTISNNFIAYIIQAADSKWLIWEKELNQARIKVEFPCRTELAEVLKKKAK